MNAYKRTMIKRAVRLGGSRRLSASRMVVGRANAQAAMINVKTIRASLLNWPCSNSAACTLSMTAPHPELQPECVLFVLPASGADTQGLPLEPSQARRTDDLSAVFCIS